MLHLIVELCQEQFHIPFPMSFLAGYCTTRASVVWVLADHGEQMVLRYLEKFYHLARRFSGLKFAPSHVSVLELHYFDVHRRLSEKAEFLQTILDLHSAIFGLSAGQVKESAKWRLLAATTVDLITSQTSTDVEGDWVKLEAYLRRCYRSIEQELLKHYTQTAARTL